MGRTEKKEEPFNFAMSLGEHLEELRLRLILALAGLAIAFTASCFFGKFIIKLIESPYTIVMGHGIRLQTLAPMDGFTTYMEIALISGVVISSPWIFYQLWMFVAAGLYQ